MEQVEVKIRVQVVTQQYGVLSEGDILRTNADFAQHLVADCGAADYVKSEPAMPPKVADAPPNKAVKAK
ncbi:MAG: hypothetical protein ACRYF5_14850 [Janthinobacterium lividum]